MGTMRSSSRRFVPSGETARLPSGRRGRHATPRRLRPAVLGLEDRLLLSTFGVTAPGDSLTNGMPTSGTLRWAVERANAEGGAETIDFDPNVFGTPRTITL